MSIQPLRQVRPPEGSVFVDNLMISSADRLLSEGYRALESERSLHEPQIAGALFHYDLLNLATLVESLVCHEKLYVNADFIDIWNKGIGTNTLAYLREIITPVEWSREERASAERILHNNEASLLRINTTESTFLSRFIEIVFRTSHCIPSDAVISRVEEKFMLPRDEAHPWGTPHHLMIGANFYLLCSQALGVPYKPSLLRARMLGGALTRAVHNNRVSATDIALSLLEHSRAEVAKDYLNRLLDFNYIEGHLPGILSAILRDATSPDQILTITRQIRESKAAVSFRAWTREFGRTVQVGDLTEIGKYMKELTGVVEDVNRYLDLDKTNNLSLKMGWGPASINHTFSLPRLLQKPIYFKRHLWFLHDLYTTLVSMARISDSIDRVFLKTMPEWLPKMTLNERIWKYAERHRRDSQSG